MEETPGEGFIDLDVRHFIYTTFALTARPPTTLETAGHFDISVAAAEQAYERLAQAHHIALAPGSYAVWMAHPFSAVPTSFVCETKERRYYANCAWDVLSIPPLLRADAQSLGRCAESGTPLEFRFEAGALVDGDAVVQLIVPPRRFWENVGYT